MLIIFFIYSYFVINILPHKGNMHRKTNRIASVRSV